jgi:hypothetical protein
MTILEFKDYLTGQKKHYKLKEDEIQLNVNCPIDGTFLIEKNYGKNYSVYVCPNCDLGFPDISKEGLFKSKNDFILRTKDKVFSLFKERDNLVMLLKKFESD